MLYRRFFCVKNLHLDNTIPMNLSQQILQIFHQSTAKYLSQKQIFALVNARTVYERNVATTALNQLVSEGDLSYDKRNNRYCLQPKEQLIEGQVDGNARGFAFLVVDGQESDYFIAPSKLNGALHKDTVLARLVPNTKDEVEVVKVVLRGVTQVVGTYDKHNGGRFVVADDNKYFKDVYIPPKKDLNAKDGQKVVAKITSYPTGNLNPEGEIVQILGYAGEHVADMLSVAHAFGIRTEFDEKTLKWASKVATTSQDDYQHRADYRNQYTITIDGADAKDLDDAITCSQNADGTYNLAVHIADVSHYVRAGGDVDKEAFLRGTSVYLPEMVFPMLPPILSNGVCSLFEGEDRLAITCQMTVNNKGNVVDFNVVKSVINSNKRTTYNQVQDILDGLQGCDSDLAATLQCCKALAQILIDKRQKRGNINFVSKEVSFVMKDGKVVDVVPRKTLFAHQIIEEFMILANETVAEYASSCGVPFVYRIHDKPDGEKVAVLLALLKGLGITVKETQDLHATSLAKALSQVQDTPYFNLINDVMLRTMQKAKYSETNSGHFGLASNCYCHFTSPIRRYADLVVHRVLTTLIQGKMTEKALDAYEEMCQVASAQASKTERVADETERKADDVKKCQYALTLMDKPLAGIVSGVTENGIFVQLDNTVEGFVSARTLTSGATQFIKEKFTLVCPHRRYSLGDKVTVQIYSVNQSACKIDMMVIDG